MERVSRRLSVSLAHTEEFFLLSLKCFNFFETSLKANESNAQSSHTARTQRSGVHMGNEEESILY